MKTPRFVAGVLLAVAFAFLGSACTTVPPRSVRVETARTYAIVVADDQGVLAPADLQKVQIGVIQFLTDEGFVNSADQFTSDVLHAAVVFRVQIAWRGVAGGFAVTEVQPSYSGGPVPSGYADETTPVPPPWYYNPWYDTGYFGQYYDSFDPFLGIYPILGIYAWNDFHPPHIVRRPPARDEHRDHRAAPPRGYSRYTPRPPDNDGWRPDPSGTQSHRPDGDNRARRGDRPDSGTHPPGTWQHRGPPSPTGDHPPGRDSSGRPPPEHRPERHAMPGTSQASPGSHYSAPPARTYAAPASSQYSAPSHASSSSSYSSPAPSYSAPAASSSSSSSSSSSQSGGDSTRQTQQR